MSDTPRTDELVKARQQGEYFYITISELEKAAFALLQTFETQLAAKDVEIARLRDLCGKAARELDAIWDDGRCNTDGRGPVNLMRRLEDAADAKGTATDAPPVIVCPMDATCQPEACAQWRMGGLCAHTGGECLFRRQVSRQALRPERDSRASTHAPVGT